MDDHDPDFWAPRNCFLAPPNSVDRAAEQLGRAADLILDDDLEGARVCVAATDLAELAEFAQLVAGPTVQSIHRVRAIAGAPPFDRSKAARMPSAQAQLAVFERDGWRCRFCGIRVINRAAIKRLNALFPDLIRWGGKSREVNGAIRIMAVSLDHILPHSRGGTNADANVVAACGPCQFGRSSWTLEEVGFTDPREREPIIDAWDGLSRLV